MKIKTYEVAKFQEGGAMPQEVPQEGSNDQLVAMAQQLVQMLIENLGDPQAVMMVLQMAAEMIQGAAAPAGAAPEGEPIFRAGGVIARRGCKVKKAACGAKTKARA